MQKLYSGFINNNIMGANSSGSLNTAGFSDSLRSGVIPPSDHLTYDGVFN